MLLPHVYKVSFHSSLPQEGRPAADAEGDPGHAGDGQEVHEALQGRRHDAEGAPLKVGIHIGYKVIKLATDVAYPKSCVIGCVIPPPRAKGRFHTTYDILFGHLNHFCLPQTTVL